MRFLKWTAPITVLVRHASSFSKVDEIHPDKVKLGDTICNRDTKQPLRNGRRKG